MILLVHFFKFSRAVLFIFPILLQFKALIQKGFQFCEIQRAFAKGSSDRNFLYISAKIRIRTTIVAKGIPDYADVA